MTTTATEATRTIAAPSYAGGVVLALISASSFGLSGSLARSLLDLGWSPAAVVATRAGGASSFSYHRWFFFDGSACRLVGKQCGCSRSG